MRHSYFLYLLSRLWVRYHSLEARIDGFFNDSTIFEAVNKSWSGVKVSFEHCFLVRLSDLEASRFLDESEVAIYFKALYKRWEKRTFGFLEASKAAYLSKEMKKEFYAASVKMGSMILVFSILVNISLSIIFKKEIGLLNWIIQGLILLAGLGGFCCQVEWETVKKNSVVFNKIFK